MIHSDVLLVTCPLTDVTQWMSRTETLSTHLGILPEAVTSFLCCSSSLSLSVRLLILIPPLFSALICQRPFVFVCEFLVSNDPPARPPTVLFYRHCLQWYRRHARRESLRSQPNPASWILSISEVCCVGPITLWLTFSRTPVSARRWYWHRLKFELHCVHSV